MLNFEIGEFERRYVTFVKIMALDISAQQNNVVSNLRYDKLFNVATFLCYNFSLLRTLDRMVGRSVGS